MEGIRFSWKDNTLWQVDTKSTSTLNAKFVWNKDVSDVENMNTLLSLPHPVVTCIINIVPPPKDVVLHIRKKVFGLVLDKLADDMGDLRFLREQIVDDDATIDAIQYCPGEIKSAIQVMVKLLKFAARLKNVADNK
jgi:hypothetical protein